MEYEKKIALNTKQVLKHMIILQTIRQCVSSSCLQKTPFKICVLKEQIHELKQVIEKYCDVISD